MPIKLLTLLLAHLPGSLPALPTGLGVPACSPAGTELIIRHEPYRQGHVLVSIFRTPEGFPDDPAKAVLQYTLPISGPTTTVRLPQLPRGTYAVSAMVDRNGNGEMDKTILGIPQEPYGFSNTSPGSLSRPNFHKAAVPIDPATRQIHVEVGLFGRR